MTLIDTPMTNGRIRIQPVSFDLYRDIHKAVRVELFDVVADTGRMDPSDRNARADVAEKVQALVTLLRQHAEHEDGAINAVLEQVDPELVARIVAEHAVIEAAMDTLLDLTAAMVDTSADGARAAAHELYLELAAFTGDYLAHQDVEERIVGPALDRALGFERLLGVHGEILSNIPPQELSSSLALMFPAMNVDDRTELLGGMKATAPAEVFEANWSLARSVLSPEDTRVLASRLGVA